MGLGGRSIAIGSRWICTLQGSDRILHLLHSLEGLWVPEGLRTALDDGLGGPLEFLGPPAGNLGEQISVQ